MTQQGFGENYRKSYFDKNASTKLAYGKLSLINRNPKVTGALTLAALAAAYFGLRDNPKKTYTPEEAEIKRIKNSRANEVKREANNLTQESTTRDANATKKVADRDNAVKAKVESILAGKRNFDIGVGAVGSAGLGGVLGYGLSDPENSVRNSILGALGGGLVGGVGTHLYQKTPKLNKKSHITKQADDTTDNDTADFRLPEERFPWLYPVKQEDLSHLGPVTQETINKNITGDSDAFDIGAGAVGGAGLGGGLGYMLSDPENRTRNAILAALGGGALGGLGTYAYKNASFTARYKQAYFKK